MLDIIYGANVVEMALKHTKVKKIFSKLRENHPIMELAREKNIPIFPIDDFQDEKRLPNDKQNIIALIEPYKYYDIKETLNDNPETILFLDQIQDPHNLGAIIRSAIAFGVKHIILPKSNSAIITPTVHKTSAGNTFLVKISVVTSVQNIIKNLKQNGYWFLGLDTKGNTKISDLDKKTKYVIVMGSEGKGIRPGILKEMDFTAFIPMNSSVESLNVSVSTAIVLYELKTKN